MFVYDDACTNVVTNSCNLATESNKLLIHRENSLRKVNLTLKLGFIVLIPAKNCQCRNSVSFRQCPTFTILFNFHSLTCICSFCRLSEVFVYLFIY